LAATCRKVSHCGRAAWCKRNIIKDKWTRAKAERAIRRVQMLRERVQTCHKGGKGVKDLGGRWSRYLKKRDLKKQ
jgi:hypothetical protein